MAEQQAISTADLTAIENGLANIYHNIDVLDSSVQTVGGNVKVVYDELGTLSKDFQTYIQEEKRRWELEHATTRLGNVRQELETKYGHYAEVRRTTTGILQATDLGIVHNDTITTAAEDLMLTCPGYWLAPCLVALAAWINDENDVANRALKEGIRRDDEKTSLLFALICRRADRKNAALLWVSRYLENQDPEKLGRESMIVLDAYASGLFVGGTENIIATQLEGWLSLLSSRPGFLERQKDNWSVALKDRRQPISSGSYKYLRQYSHTWPVLEDILEGAYLHENVLGYFESIFSQPSSDAKVIEQLDELMTSLVTGFDDEELPLRREERECQLIIEFSGDVARARSSADAEKASMEETRDFTQLLTSAAMHPEVAHSSIASQKFSVAYSKEWIEEAYNDLTASNRMKIPTTIEINVDTFNDLTVDGSDEERLVKAFNDLVSTELANELDTAKLTSFEQYCQYGGFACLAVGLMSFASGSIILGLLAIIAGIGLIMKHYSREKIVAAQRQKIQEHYDEKREKGTKIVKATVAEVVDFRAEFQEQDAKSQEVLGFLEQLSPDQYVRAVSGSTHRIAPVVKS